MWGFFFGLWDHSEDFIILGYISSIAALWIGAEWVRYQSARMDVCKALAGLELGQWHEVDELVIYAGLNRHVAQQVIDGEYDALLNDPLTCRYIG